MDTGGDGKSHSFIKGAEGQTPSVTAMLSNFLPLLLVSLLATDALAARKYQEDTRRTNYQQSQKQSEEAGDLTDECPEPNGYFADGYQCDKYYECKDGVITEKLCPDGMVFNDYSIQHEKCDLPFNIDCSQRSQLQPPRPTTHCPRQNGYFSHEDPKVCDKFYFCVDGKFNMITCPDGLVYNEKTGICTWPDEAKKKHCSSEASEKGDKDKMKTRKKRLSVWKANEESSASYEDEEYPLSEDDYYDYTGGSSSTDFANFDAEFADFDKNDGDSSGEKERNDYDMLDEYIYQYVKQLNNPKRTVIGGVPDLRYYEKIAEQAVEDELAKRQRRNSTLTCKDVRKRRQVFKFECPKVDMKIGQQHPRYPDPEDCQFFYVCINGEVPRRNGCKIGQVFNEQSGSCDWPRNVPECREWYKGVLTDEELEALEHPKPKVRNSTSAAAYSKRNKSKVQPEY